MQERIKVNGWEDWDTDMEWGQALLSAWHPISVQKRQRDRWRRWRVKMQNPHLKGKQRKMIITVVPNVKSICVNVFSRFTVACKRSFHVLKYNLAGVLWKRKIFWWKEKLADYSIKLWVRINFSKCIHFSFCFSPSTPGIDEWTMSEEASFSKQRVMSHQQEEDR